LADKTFLDIPGPSFAVSFIKSEDYAVSACCWYRYSVGTDPVVLHGNRSVDGNFWPKVTCEVATEGKAKWKRLEASVEHDAPESVTVSPDYPVTTLWVDMEPFRKTIGMFRYGRLVLENGETAVFAIEDLLPTADAKGDTNDFKASAFEISEGKEQRGFEPSWIAAPTELLDVISFGGRLLGDFTYQARAKSVVLEGTRTLDGDFWPKVTLQAAGTDHIWKTIGESQNNGASTTLQIANGKSERIRVVLTAYQPLVGKFKFGKITFSNGQFGVFSIDLLDPK
jgi:hypothetical protein